MDTEMLIGSKFETGHREPRSRSSIPKTGADHPRTCPKPRQARSSAAVAAAEKAFATWSRTTPAQRSGYLLKIADRIEAEAEDFAALEALNCGKPINAVLNDEIPAIVDCYRFFAGAVRTMPGAVAGEYLPGHTSMVRRDPIGIVASIAPWNYPLMMMAWKLAPAHRRRQHRGLQAVRADAADRAEAGEDPGRNPARGRRQCRARARRQRRQRADQPSQGQHDLDHRRCRHRQEGAAGRRANRSSARIWSSAARRRSSSSTTPTSTPWSTACAPSATTMPARTAPPPAASMPARRSTTSSSPTSPRPSRRSSTTSRTTRENEIGPLISQAPARPRRRASSSAPSELKHIEITTGGKPGEGDGFFYQPTVVAGALQDDEIVRREVFGPVVSVTRFSDVDEAVDLGQRQRLRPRLVGVDQGCRPRHGDRGAAAIWLHLDQHATSCWPTRCRMAG